MSLLPHLKVVFPNGRSEIYLLEEEIDFNPLGYRVLVPLKSSQRGATAVVVKKFLARASEDTLRVDSFPDRFPVISPPALEVLKNNLLEYLTTLGESVFRLIPTWADWYQETFATAVDREPKGLPKTVLKIFEKLKKRGRVEYEKLKKEFDPKVLRLLQEHRLIKIETRWIAPKVEEEFFKAVTTDREEVLKRIKRAGAKRKEEVLRAISLFEELGRPLEREELLNWGVSSQTLRYMVEKGILRRVTYSLPPFRGELLKSPRGVYAPLNPPNRWELRNLSLRERIETLLRVGEWVISQGGDLLVLIPELELLEEFHQRFNEVFGDRALVYSETLPQKEKIKNWFRAYEGYGKIFITTPQWLFAPLKNPLAVYIEDEGHPAYKMFRKPYFNLKRLAFEYANLLGAKLIVSSEPPSVEQFLISKTFEVKEKERETTAVILEEKDPFGDGVLIQYLRREGKHLILTPKRGYSNLYCSRCGIVLECPRCEVYLTYHPEGWVECSACGFRSESIECPRCGEKTKPFGYGVERVKETLKLLLPEGDFTFSTHPPYKGEFDTVAVLFADSILSVPDFRKGEEFYRYLVKAKNRTKEGGLFLLHTLQGEHPAIKSLMEGNPLFFYKEEIEFRKLLELPPFARLYLVALNLKEENEELALKIFKRLKVALKFTPAQVEFSKAPTFRLRERYRYQILVKLPLKLDKEELKKTAQVLKELKNSYPFVRVIPNPRSLV
jgi:primosomal protein N' (replication factor Y)